MEGGEAGRVQVNVEGMRNCVTLFSILIRPRMVKRVVMRRMLSVVLWIRNCRVVVKDKMVVKVFLELLEILEILVKMVVKVVTMVKMVKLPMVKVD